MTLLTIQFTALELPEQFTTATRHQVKLEALEHLGEGRTYLEADASRCGYMDSAALGVLVSIAKRCREAGGQFRVRGLNEDQRVQFRLTMLDQVLEVVE